MIRIGHLIVALIVLSPFAYAADWSQWRGEKRDAQISATDMPDVWPEKLDQVWSVAVGEGHASPVMQGDKIFVFARTGERENLQKIDSKDGRTIWQQGYDAAYSINFAASSHGKGPKSTPVIRGTHIVTFGISGILSCFDTERGKIHWQKTFSKAFPQTSPDYGSATSPLIEEGLVIVHIGGEDRGALTAFDLQSGEIKWQWIEDAPAYASPVVATFSGVKQIVTFSRAYVVGVDFVSGKSLWEMPFTTPWSQNCVTPVLVGEDIIISGLDQGISRIHVMPRDGVWSVSEKWKNTDFSAYMSTPLLFDDILLAFSNNRKGTYVSLDVNTGKELWKSQGREGENAAMIRAGDSLLSIVTDGNLVVARKTGVAFSPVKVYQVADTPIWAHPVLFDRHIAVKDRERLTLWRLE